MHNLRNGIRSSILALLGPALLACGAHNSAPDSSLVLLGDTPSPEGRNCRVAALPKQLPTAAAIMDIARFERALSAEFPESATARGVLFSVRFALDGQLLWVEPIHGVLMQAQQEQLQRLVGQSMRPQPGAGESWSVRLRVRPGAPDALLVGRSEVCSVERVALEAGRTASGVMTMSSGDLADLQHAGPFRVGVEVGTVGKVLHAEMLQSSGSRIQDERALKAARTGKYLPALIDGIPVVAQYEVRSRR